MRRLTLVILGLLLAVGSLALPEVAGALEPEGPTTAPSATGDPGDTDPADTDPAETGPGDAVTDVSAESADQPTQPPADDSTRQAPPQPVRVTQHAAVDGPCASVAAVQWGAAPTTVGQRGVGGAECFEFTTGSFGTYLFRAVPDDDAWSPGFGLFEADQPVGAMTGYASYGAFYQLKASTTYQVQVSGDPGAQPRGYRVGYYAVAAATGCDAVPGLGWSAASEFPTQNAAGAVDCQSFSVPTGRAVRLAGDAGYATVLNAAGDVVCNLYRWSMPGRCVASGAGPYRVITSDWGDAATDAHLMVTDTESSTGCTAITLAAWNAALPTRADRAADGSGTECYALSTTRAASYGLRAGRTDNRWNSRLEVWESGSGDLLHQTSVDIAFTELSLRGSRTYRFVVSGDPDGYPGGVALGVYDITQQAGCATLPGLDWDDAPATFDLADDAVGCVEFASAAARTLRSAAQRTSAEGETWFRLYNAAGVNLCSFSTGSVYSCITSGTGPYRLLAAPSWSDAAAARVHLNDISSAQGCATVALGTWGTALPGSATRAADGSGAECFTVTTAAAGSYAMASWFGSTQWSPRVELWDTDSKTQAWQSYTSWWYQYQPVSLRGTTAYRVVVSGDPDGYDNSYAWGLTQVAGGGTCAAITGVDWSSTPEQGTLAEGEIDCRQLNAESGSYVRVRVARTGELGQPRVEVVNKAGDVLCQVDVGHGSTCRLTGVGPFRMLAHSVDPVGTTAYRFWITDPASSIGCGAASSSTAEPAQAGILAPDTAAVCYDLGSTAGAVYVPATHPSWSVRGVVLNGRGDELCGTDQACVLSGPAPYRLSWTSTSEDTETYAFRVLRPTTDDGSCLNVASVAYGFEPLSGKVVEDLDVRCYEFAATTGDQLRFRPRDLSGQESPGMVVFGPSGGAICSVDSAYWDVDLDCTAAATGRHTAYVIADASSLGRYQLSAECLNPACGPDELTVLSANPKTIGQSSSVTVTLQGKNFDRSQTVTLSRLGTVLTGQVIDVSSDRRTIRVLFDLSTAGVGSWNVKVASTDGEEATYASAVTVTAPGEPKVTASLTGLGRFVPGRPQTMSLTVTNAGNVDGIGVPIVLRGFPAGSTIEPQFTLYGLDAAGEAVPATITPGDDDIFTAADGSLGIPLYINRMPAGGRVDVSFRVTVPVQANYDLLASVGQCMVNPNATGGVARAAAITPGVQCANATYNALTDAAFEAVPGAACVSGVRDVVETGVTNWAENGSPFSFGGWGDVLEFGVSTVFSGLNCAADFFPPTKVAKTVLKVASTAWGLGTLGKTCYEDGVALGNSWVTSLDPNEIVGPAGGGTNNAIRGEGRQHYAIYFENSKDASAPAQVVKVDTTLDATKFDMSSLTFGALQFGTTIWTPAEGATELDHSLDLVSDDGLQLHITAAKNDSGKLSWLLETIDPVTGDLPEDPLLGFLPPNDDGTEGQGVVFFDVGYTAAVQSGTTVSAKADIVFDLNAPIATNTWSNRIDRVAPTAAVSGVPKSTTNPNIPVTWGGSDGQSGITQIDVFVAVDGGSYALWKSAAASGKATYPGAIGHRYAFVAVARDGAGNASAMPSVPHATTQVLRVFKYSGPRLALRGTPTTGSTLRSNFAPTKVVPRGTVRYQWFRGTKAIAGRTAATYKVTRTDRGKLLSLRITITRSGYAPKVLKSNSVRAR